MNRHRQHRSISAKDVRGPVALMHIQINHRNSFALYTAGLHRNVVEYAKSRALPRESMMRSARQSSAPSRSESVPGSRERRSNRSESASYQSMGPGEADPPHGRRAQSSLEKRLDIFRSMYSCDSFNFGVRSLLQTKKPSLLQEFPNHPIFLDWKLVLRGKRKHKMISVEQAWSYRN